MCESLFSLREICRALRWRQYWRRLSGRCREFVGGSSLRSWPPSAGPAKCTCAGQTHRRKGREIVTVRRYVFPRWNIEIRGKLTDGWRARQNTFGFVEQDQLDWRFDTRLRIQLEILARPSGRGPGYKEFPSTLQCNANYQGIRCWVNDGQCLLRVKFVGSDDSPNQELPWRLTTNNKLAVFWSYGFGALGILPSYDA